MPGGGESGRNSSKYRGWSLVSDDVCLDKTYAEKECISFREIIGAWLLSHLLPQKLL